jgi:hypothetical protein
MHTCPSPRCTSVTTSMTCTHNTATCRSSLPSRSAAPAASCHLGDFPCRQPQGQQSCNFLHTAETHVCLFSLTCQAHVSADEPCNDIGNKH